MKEIKIFEDTYLVFSEEDRLVEYKYSTHKYKRKNIPYEYPSASSLANLSLQYFDDKDKEDFKLLKPKNPLPSPLQRGTSIHSYIEDAFRKNIVDKEQKLIDVEFHVKKINALLKTQFPKCLEINILADYMEKPYLAINKENPEIGFGGKVDLLFEVSFKNKESERIVVDIKSGKKNDNYKTQIMSYCLIHNANLSIIYYIDTADSVIYKFNKDSYESLLNRFSQYKEKEKKYISNALSRDYNDDVEDEKEAEQKWIAYLEIKEQMKKMQLEAKDLKKYILDKSPSLLRYNIKDNIGLKTSVVARKQKKYANEDGLDYLQENHPVGISTKRSVQTLQLRIIRSK